MLNNWFPSHFTPRPERILMANIYFYKFWKVIPLYQFPVECCEHKRGKKFEAALWGQDVDDPGVAADQVAALAGVVVAEAGDVAGAGRGVDHRAHTPLLDRVLQPAGKIHQKTADYRQKDLEQRLVDVAWVLGLIARVCLGSSAVWRVPWPVPGVCCVCCQGVIVNGEQEQDARRGCHEGIREDHTPMSQVILPGPIGGVDRVQDRQLRLK